MKIKGLCGFGKYVDSYHPFCSLENAVVLALLTVIYFLFMSR
jgi:hypothetical protein